MMDDSLESVLRQAVGDNLVTHFVAILEVMTQDGLDLRIATSDSLTAWTAAGMIRIAGDLITSGAMDFDDGETNE